MMARAAFRHWAIALLVVVVVATYANTLGNGFVWDDFDIIVDNAETQDLGSLGKVLFSPDMTPPYYRPLPRALFVLEYGWFRGDASVAHGINLLWHLAAVLLLYQLGRVLLRRKIPSLIVALLWAVHPVGAEAVGFVSVRTNSMAMASMFASLVMLWRGLERDDRAWFFRSAVAFLAALGSKEQAIVVLPLAALIIWLAPKLGGPKSTRKTAFVILTPHFIALGLYLAARSYALGGLFGQVPRVVGRDSAMGIYDMVLAVGKYISLFVWPAELTVVHDLRAEHAAPLVVAFGLAIALSLACLRSPTPARSFGLAWFWLTLIPTLQVVALPSAPFAERHAYFIIPGLLLIVVDFAAAALDKVPLTKVRAAVLTAAAGAVIALSIRTVVRNQDWHDNRTLFESSLAVRPSSLAYLNLGNDAIARGDTATATDHWRAAVAMNPKDADALNQLGVVAAQAGRFEAARHYFGRALEALPGHPVAMRNLRSLPPAVSR